MTATLDLNGSWKIKGFDRLHGMPESYTGASADERGFIEAQVPGDIHLDLERAGVIPDCRLAMNARSARWVCEHEWVYRRTFDAPARAAKSHAWLVFDGLDLVAAVYLNGELVGRHANAFVPCRIDVTGKLKAGENLLAVHVESGLLSVSERSAVEYGASQDGPLDQRLSKRSWLRKPQYQFGWDWNPRLVNVGIFKPVRLEWSSSVRIDAVSLRSRLSFDSTTADIRVRAFLDNPGSEPVNAVLHARTTGRKIASACEVTLPPGISTAEVSLEIPDPKLWWPRGHGEPNLYEVTCEVEVDGKVVDKAKRRTGIRGVFINQEPHIDGGEYFTLEVNGEPVFAKGGNWVPPDILYGRPDASTYRRLAEIAVDANFNMLRVWGGGLYADHALLDACDELGIMVWHDFQFACAKYPCDDAEFLKEVRQEVTFVARDLSHHPSMLVWCGNNELEWANWDWGFDQLKPFPDHALYHMEIPRILRAEDIDCAYWPSSPYSTEGRHPNDATTGDQHPWQVVPWGTTEFRDLRKDASRFPNEGGFLGASSPATLARFLPEGERRPGSPSWHFHDNSTNFGVPRGHAYKMVADWTGLDPDTMSLEDYAFYSGVIHAEALTVYIDNYRRRMFDTSCAVFWMYNDSWPATHSWTIVDYYLRRKLAYHPVRRAFQPVRVIPVETGDKVIMYGVNDTPKAWNGEVRYGIFSLRGGLASDQTEYAWLAPNASLALAEIAMSDWTAAGPSSAGVFACLTSGGKVVSQNRLLGEKFRDLRWGKPRVTVQRKGARAVFSSRTYVWAVCLDPNGEMDVPDDVFDLIPGIDYAIPWPEDRPLPVVTRTASPLLGNRVR